MFAQSPKDAQHIVARRWEGVRWRLPVVHTENRHARTCRSFRQEESVSARRAEDKGAAVGPKQDPLVTLVCGPSLRRLVSICIEGQQPFARHAVDRGPRDRDPVWQKWSRELDFVDHGLQK